MSQISANKDRRVIIETQAELDAFGNTYFQLKRQWVSSAEISVPTIWRRGD